MQGKATGRLAAVAVVFSIIAAGCGGLGKVHTDVPGATATATLAAFEGQLKAAGIPVTAGFPQTAARFEVSDYQAQAMAEQLAEHQGVPGFQLDKEVAAAHGMPPVSYLIAAWILGAHTVRSATVKGWMGTQDWHDAPKIIFPAAVLVMFSADMADHIATDWARTGSTSTTGHSPARRFARSAAVLADVVGSPCSTVDTFFGNTMVQLFNALHLSPSFLGNSGPLGIVSSFLAGIWNTLVDLVHGAVNGIVATLTAPIAAAISVAVGAVGLISQAASFLGAWSLRVVVTPPGGPPPGIDRFSIGAEPPHQNTLVVSASSLVDQIPAAIRDCATSLGSPLPTTLVPGTPITWNVIANAEGVVAFPKGLTATVNQAGSATLAWTTGHEPAAIGQIVAGSAYIHTKVSNPGADALANLARNLVQSAIARIAGSAVAPAIKNFLDGIAAPVLADAQSGAYDQSATVPFDITHHCGTGPGCSDTPQPTPGSSTSGTPAPSGVVHSCGIAPASLVGAVLGVPATGPQQFDLGAGVIQCLYASQVDKPAVLRFYNNIGTASFAALEAAAQGHGQAVTDTNFQDEAFTSTSTGRGLTLTELYARRGSLVIAVYSSADLAAEEKLETQIFANVYHH